jgi:hypothetical protein
MASDPEKLSCAEFRVQLVELMNSGEDATRHPHAQTCEQCRSLAASLAADLEVVREAARRRRE